MTKMSHKISDYPLVTALLLEQKWAINESALEVIRGALIGSEINGEAMHSVEVEDFNALAAHLGDRIDGTRYARRRGSVGIVTVYGPIIPRSTWLERASGLVSVESIASDIRRLQSDASIKEILMLFDTPGGSVTGISELGKLIASSDKKIRGHNIGMMYSAGYWLGSQTSKLTSVDTGEIGSIGIIATLADTTAADEKKGVKKFNIVSSQSPRKKTDLTTAEGRTELQAILDGIADIFISAVADGRGFDKENVLKEWGQGGGFVAKDAWSRGMIDNIITTEDLIKEIQAENSLFGAVAAATRQETNMSNVDTNVPTVDAPPDIEQERANAASAEADRIRKIESIKGEFDGSPQEVKDAVGKVVDDNKFDASKSYDAVKMDALNAVVEAQNKMLKSKREAQNNVGDSLGDLPHKTEEEKKGDVDKQRINNLAAGMKKAGRRVA